MKGIKTNTGRTHFKKGFIPWNKNKKGVMPIPWNKGKKGEYKLPGVSEKLRGKKHSEETKRKMIKSAKRGKENNRWTGRIPKCIDCGAKVVSRSSKVKRCIKCFYKTRIGKNNNNWKGGITPVNEKIRKSMEYKLWREAVFKRDNYQCIFGGKEHGNRINADHIKSFAEFPELRFAIDNGRTLCEECHRKTNTWGRPKKYV